MIRHSMYHRVLRVFSLVVAFVLLFESGLISDSTARISSNTHMYLANAVGVGATVTPTELNQYTAALTQKEQELLARETALRDREIAVNLSTESSDNDRAVYVLASILFILLVLIVLNYTLDYLRIRERKELQTV